MKGLNATSTAPTLTAPYRPDPACLLEGLPIAVMVVAPPTTILTVNYAAEEFFGTSKAILTKTSLAHYLPKAHPVLAMIARVRQSGRSMAEHGLMLEGPRLTRRGCTVLATPVNDQPELVMLTFQDDSTAKALDQQIAPRTAARSLTGMAAILAHEVKNPLSGIRGAAQLLEGSLPAADRDLAVLIRDEADRIRAMIERMERFGDQPSATGAVNIHSALDHVRRIAASGFAGGIKFIEQYDPSLPLVPGDHDQLIQALLNLVKNAAEAILESGREDGEIHLITRFQHTGRLTANSSPVRASLPILVVIQDNGTGIAATIKPYLFEPFISSKVTGSGLGLALVTKIIADHGGLIDVESQAGHTAFRLHLPASEQGEA